MRRDFGHFFWCIWRNRLFKPHRVIRLELFGQTNRARCRELTVGAEQNIGTIADGFANRRDHSYAAINCRQRRLSAVINRIWASRVKFYRSETPLNFTHGGLGSKIWVAIYGVIRVGIKLIWRIQICVAPQAIVNLTAEQFINRFAGVFAADVPHRHFKAADNTSGAEVWSMRKTRTIGTAPHFFNVKRIRAEHIANENIFGDFAHNLRRICRRINFTDTGYAGIGG